MRPLDTLPSVLVVAVAACGGLDRCGTSRSLELDAVPDATQPADVDAHLALIDSEEDDNDQFVWWIGFTPDNPTDSAVVSSHLHRAGTGETLFTFPIDQWRPDGNTFSWEVSTFLTSRYQGDLPFDDFFALLQSGGTYVDVHTATLPDGARAPVALNTFQDWTTMCD